MAKTRTEDDPRPIERHAGGIRVTFSLTWALLALAIPGILLVSGFVAWPGHRPTLRFLVAVLATLGGVAGAYYVGRGLRDSTRAQRITRSFMYPARWGDPTWAQARAALADLLAKCQGQPDDKKLDLVEDAMRGNPGLEVDVRAILNFLEELALAINLGVVEEEILDRFYRTMVVRSFSALSPWVKKHRQEREAPRIWVEIETLFATWEKKV